LGIARRGRNIKTIAKRIPSGIASVLTGAGYVLPGTFGW